jgi:DNA invertase Pin-like site-specific DNA recombinase
MTAHRGKFVAYFRVSTDKQGKSGLGLDAQRKAVEDYLNGGTWSLIGEFTEVESGKRSDRPKLAEALKSCRLQNATLIIAKLDRLARNVAFISNLMESKVEFEAVDFPQANRLTIHIMAAIAEHGAKMISDRTRAALAAAKARGKRLGGFRGRAARRRTARKPDRPNLLRPQLAPLISHQSSTIYELPVQIRCALLRKN